LGAAFSRSDLFPTAISRTDELPDIAWRLGDLGGHDELVVTDGELGVDGGHLLVGTGCPAAAATHDDCAVPHPVPESAVVNA